ncbi:MAG: proton-conducting transporter membrane subunit, partial [Candidatus Aureabacteria bacterium]|nr:proton-conducting transporter membrane subunit [Candidatus Auribacterota bacterium]
MLPLILDIAFLGALLAPLVGRGSRRVSSSLAACVTFLLLCLSVRAALSVCGGVFVEHAFPMRGAIPGLPLALDGLSAFMLMPLNLIAFLSALYSIDYMERYTGRWQYDTLFLLMVAGLNGVLMAGNLCALYVFLELATIASGALVAFRLGSEELEAGYKYMAMAMLASLFILLGMAFLYAAT